MGYSQGWSREPEIPAETMRMIVEDFGKLILVLDDNGVSLAGPNGDGPPEITAERIAFNGFATSGRYRNNGSGRYEPFLFERVAPLADWEKSSWNPKGRTFGTCKTALRPYDIAVCCALLIAKRHLGTRIGVYTDGEEVQWFNAKLLCQSVLGYGIEYAVADGKLVPIDPGGESRD
jgi:hypothetical protein